MVDRERVLERIQRVEELVAVLEGIRRGGKERVLGDRHVQLETERAIQVAIQACIDIGAQLVAERGLRAPDDYRGVFERLEGAGMLDGRLARQLGDAAGLRNILVHGYLDVDVERLWSSLTELRTSALVRRVPTAAPASGSDMKAAVERRGGRERAE